MIQSSQSSSIPVLVSLPLPLGLGFDLVTRFCLCPHVPARALNTSTNDFKSRWLSALMKDFVLVWQISFMKIFIVAERKIKWLPELDAVFKNAVGR